MLARSICLSLLLLSQLAFGQDEPTPTCDDLPVYQALDFWVGEWDVYIGDKLVGRNRVEKTLMGCAVTEHWRATDGGEGKSLFFVDYDGHWAQIWVSQWAMTPGGVKEKVMVDDPAAGIRPIPGRGATSSDWRVA